MLREDGNHSRLGRCQSRARALKIMASGHSVDPIETTSLSPTSNRGLFISHLASVIQYALLLGTPCD